MDGLEDAAVAGTSTPAPGSTQERLEAVVTTGRPGRGGTNGTIKGLTSLAPVSKSSPVAVLGLDLWIKEEQVCEIAWILTKLRRCFVGIL